MRGVHDGVSKSAVGSDEMRVKNARVEGIRRWCTTTIESVVEPQ